MNRISNILNDKENYEKVNVGRHGEVYIVDDFKVKSLLKSNSRIENAKREKYALNTLQSFNIKAPKLFNSKTNNNFIHLVMEYVPSVTLNKIIENNSVRRLAIDIGKNISILHSINHDKIQNEICYHNEKKIDKIQSDINKTVEETINIVSGEKLETYIPTIKKSRNGIEQLSTEDITVCHGDLHLDNIRLSKDGSITIVDWEGFGFFDPAYDICKLETTFLDVLDGYKNKFNTVKKFREVYGLCDKMKKRIQLYKLMYIPRNIQKQRNDCSYKQIHSVIYPKEMQKIQLDKLEKLNKKFK